MRTKVELSDRNISIYQELSNVLSLGILVSVFCIGFGISFIRLMPENLYPELFGSIFIAAGILILLGLPKYYSTMKNKVGAIIFEADVNGIAESLPLNTLPYNYSWNSIEKIILTSKYVEKGLDSDGASYSWNIMLIYFKAQNDKVNFIQRSQKKISISPKGYDFIIIPFPINNLSDIKESLISLSKNTVEIVSCEKIEFHYGKDTETITS